jgi:hypothetical protein
MPLTPITGAIATQLANEAGLSPANVPSWGVRISSAGRDYMMFYRADRGYVAIDETTYDSTGTRIDPSVADESTIRLWWEALGAGVKDSVPQVIDYALLAGAAALGLVVWIALREGGGRR